MCVLGSVNRSACDVITGAKIANTGPVKMPSIPASCPPPPNTQPLCRNAFRHSPTPTPKAATTETKKAKGKFHPSHLRKRLRGPRADRLWTVRPLPEHRLGASMSSNVLPLTALTSRIIETMHVVFPRFCSSHQESLGQFGGELGSGRQDFRPLVGMTVACEVRFKPVSRSRLRR